MKRNLSILLVLTLLVAVSSLSDARVEDPLKGNTLLVTSLSYFPPSLKDAVGASFERMVYTRLSQYFTVMMNEKSDKGSHRYTLSLTLTKIGDAVSLDSSFRGDRGKKRVYSFSGKSMGDIPHLIEKLSKKLGEIVSLAPPFKEPSPSTRLHPSVQELEKKVRKRISKFVKYLPQGNTAQSSSFGGGYYYFSGGDITGGNSEEIVAISREEVSVKRITGDSLTTLFTRPIDSREEIIYLACGDLSGDGREDIALSLLTEEGIKGMILYYDGKEKSFKEVSLENSLMRISHDVSHGTVLLIQRMKGSGVPSKEVEFATLRDGKILLSHSIDSYEGFSLARGIPLYTGNTYHFIEFGDGYLRDHEDDSSLKVSGNIEDVRAVDVNGDGDQEILLFLSKKGKSRFFESLPMKNGFAVELYVPTGKGLKREYSYVNTLFKPGGYFPRISRKGRVNAFIVVSLEGNDFYPPSIRWRVVTIK